MNIKVILAALSLSLISTFAHAEHENREHRNMPPEVKAAFQECHGTVAKDENGRPNREAMRDCLKGKGVEPPKHPPMSEKDKAAFVECKTTVPKTPEGNPDKKFMKKCWHEKTGRPMRHEASPEVSPLRPTN